MNLALALLAAGALLCGLETSAPSHKSEPAAADSKLKPNKITKPAAKSPLQLAPGLNAKNDVAGKTRMKEDDSKFFAPTKASTKMKSSPTGTAKPNKVDASKKAMLDASGNAKMKSRPMAITSAPPQVDESAKK